MEHSYVLQLSDRKFTDLNLSFCGYAQCQPGHSFGPALRPNYLIHYILKGKGIYQVGQRSYPLGEGEGFLIRPQAATFYQADQEDPWAYLWIGFDGDKADQYLADLGLEGEQLIFSSPHRQELQQIVLDMLRHNTSTLTNRFHIQSLLYEFFSLLTRDRHTAPLPRPGGENPYVLQALDFIRQNYAYPIHVTDIANYACITRNYLYTLFKAHLDMTPQEYLARFRIARSLDLLSNTDLSIESIALSCGYSDPMVFSKAFKARQGITPSRHRKEIRAARSLEPLPQEEE